MNARAEPRTWCAFLFAPVVFVCLNLLGFPGSIEGKRHLRKMLQSTRSRLTDHQIDEIVETLRDR
jgi:hypothetical protein